MLSIPQFAKQVGCIGLILCFFLLAACSTSSDPSETYRGETSEQIYQRAEDALRDHNYQEAIKRFEALDVQYPYSKHTQTAQLHSIYAYYMTSDYASAESAADRFIHAWPASPHVDYAWYLRGVSDYYQNLGIYERVFAFDPATRDTAQIEKAWHDFAVIARSYPESRYAPAARQYMLYLRNVLANQTLEIAQFYYDKAAYVAAINRASEVVQHFEGAPAVPDALVIMAKSYTALHLTASAANVQRIIAYNWPDSRYVREANQTVG